MINGLRALFVVFNIVLFLYIVKQIKNTYLSEYRTDLFSLRIELLMLFKTNDIELNSDYREYEDLINNYLRFAHKISFLDLVIFRFQNKNIEFEEKSYFVCDETQKVKVELEDLKLKLSLLTVKYFFKTSLLCKLYVLIEYIKSIIQVKNTKTKEKINSTYIYTSKQMKLAN